MSKNQRKLEPRPLIAGNFYRLAEGPLFFGLKSSQLSVKIEDGEIPAPISLTDSGRAKGWFGEQILQWQSERMKAAAKRKAAA